MPKVHRYDTEGEAYDNSQCDDDVKDGDVLVTPYSIGILVEAWPVRAFHDGVAREDDWDNAFHILTPGSDWSKLWQVGGQWGDYIVSLDLARAVWASTHQDNKITLTLTMDAHSHSVTDDRHDHMDLLEIIRRALVNSEDFTERYSGQLVGLVAEVDNPLRTEVYRRAFRA